MFDFDSDPDSLECEMCNRRIKDIIEDGVLAATTAGGAYTNPPTCRLLCHKCYKKTITEE